MRLRWLAGLSVLLLLVLGSAHHRPDHPTPPGQTTTTTTTTVPTTTTTAPTTTTTLPSLNLTADLVITSDTTLTGHIEGNGFQILIDGANVTMTNLTVNNVNRIMWHGACGVATLTNVTVTNSGTGELGFYPLHWHLCGNSTRGTVVDNVTVEFSRNRAFVPHGSNGITFLNVIAREVIGEAFWWDAGQGINDSHDIVIDGALVDTVYSGRYPPSWGGDINDRRHHRNSAFVLRGGTGLIIRNSTALNVRGGTDCSGFHWPENAGEPAVWVFENNHSVSADCHGIFVWQNDAENHVVDGFTGSVIDHGAYRNIYDYRNVYVEGVEVHALGWTMSDSHAGHVITRAHKTPASPPPPVTFTNVTFDSFTVDNDNNGQGMNYGVYILNGSNLTCVDVVYQSVFPGTQVIIDGVEC